MYGISRIDSDRFCTHAWREKFVRRGQTYVKNFPDKRHGGKGKALAEAKTYRDELVAKHPPISRREFCTTPRRNNRSGITGVYRYAKPYKLKNGKVIENWYWEATWPNGNGQQSFLSFSMKKLGEIEAKRLATMAREKALDAIDGYYWASARGV